MPITLKLNLLDPAAVYDDGEDSIKITVIGLAQGIPIDTPANILPAALEAAGMPGRGEGHPTKPQAKLKRRVVRPVDAGDKARIELYYDSNNDFDLNPNGTFVLRDSTALTNELVQLDGSFNPIQVVWTPTGGSAVTKTVSSPRTTSIRTLSAFATLDQKPSIDTLIAVDDVNDRTWQGRPKGYWKCIGLDATYQDATGSIGQYSAGAVFMTRNWRDWSEYSFYTDQFGEIPSVDDGLSPSEIISIMKAPYTIGQTQGNGFTKTGHYNLANFGAIFGLD